MSNDPSFAELEDESEDSGLSDLRASVDVSRPFAGCCVLTPYGEIDAYTAPVLRERVIEAFGSAQVTRLVIDLTHTTFLDSSALGVLVSALKRARERDARLEVVTPPAAVRRIFEITNLERVLELHDTLESALGA